jgi:ABC-type nitrate/sulfonate/bicarbonate transport system ATPase subunit
VIVLSRGPARIHEEVVVALPHPRSYDDPEVFKLSSHVTNHILTLTDSPDSLVAT